MLFNLYHKEYDARVSMLTFDKYYERANKCLWTSLLDIDAAAMKITASKGSMNDLYNAVGEIMPMHFARYFMYLIAKNCDSAITQEEIHDGIMHSGAYPDDSGIKTWQLVILDLSRQFQEDLREHASVKKK